MARPVRLKVYYLGNIDGRRSGMIAARSKSEVRRVVRMPPDEIDVMDNQPRAQEMALKEPGVLFVTPIFVAGGFPKDDERVWEPRPERRLP